VEMVLWKLRKLLPALSADVALVYAPMPVLGDEKRVLAAATSRAAIEAIEHSFEDLGVRIGYLAPSSLALFEGLAPALSEAAGGHCSTARAARALSSWGAAPSRSSSGSARPATTRTTTRRPVSRSPTTPSA